MTEHVIGIVESQFKCPFCGHIERVHMIHCPICSTRLYRDSDEVLMHATGVLERYIAEAKRKYHVDGEVEIDDDAVVSHSDEGAYVQAWVWVSKYDVEEDDGDL